MTKRLQIDPTWLAIAFAVAALFCATLARGAIPTTAPVRVLVDANLTPINNPNPKWIDDGKGTDPDRRGERHWQRNTLAHDYAVSLGLEECWTIGNGTLNRHPWWSACKDMADFNARGMTQPEGNFCDPPTQQACYEVGRLLRNPARFNATARPHCPAFLDFEGEKTFVCFPGYDLPVRKQFLRDWIKTLGWIRDGAGADQELSIYGLFLYSDVHGDDDDAELAALLVQLNDQLTTACTTNYFWDWPAENRAGRIFTEMGMGERAIRRHMPTHVGCKVAFVNPYYQTYWPQNDLPDAAALNLKPVPLETWRRQIAWLVAHDYVIVLWLGNSDAYPIRFHIQELAACARN